MYELQWKLWLTPEGLVVEDGDPRARALLGSAGKKIPESLARDLGLLEDAGVEEEEVESYSDWTVDQLREELGFRDLPLSGTKKELVARLEESDAEDDE